MFELKKPWKEKEDKIINKDDFLNELSYEKVSDFQQMLYLLYIKMLFIIISVLFNI